MVNTSGNDGMAVGGSGDVLTGVLCSLVAQGMEPYAAARLGVYLHGRAGDEARERCGACSMIARDLADGVKAVLRSSVHGKARRGTDGVSL
jgi:NAD(P)H-hydrate epimerase